MSQVISEVGAFTTATRDLINANLIVHQATVTLTNAEIIALPTNTTGIELVADLGGSKVPLLVGGCYEVNTLAAAYSGITVDDAYLAISFAIAGVIQNDAGGYIINSTAGGAALSGFLGQMRHSFSQILGRGYVDADYATLVSYPYFNVGQLTGAGLVVSGHNADGVFGGGDGANTLRVSILYLIYNAATHLFE